VKGYVKEPKGHVNANKATELFQTMAIMNPNMVNLTLEVNSLKKIIATWEKEKEKTFQKGYKHNVEI
jgi:hypothetical protein